MACHHMLRHHADAEDAFQAAALSLCGSTSIRHTSDGFDLCSSRKHRNWLKLLDLHMRRRHLIELKDLAWWPRLFRDGVTDYLATLLMNCVGGMEGKV